MAENYKMKLINLSKSNHWRLKPAMKFINTETMLDMCYLLSWPLTIVKCLLKSILSSSWARWGLAWWPRTLDRYLNRKLDCLWKCWSINDTLFWQSVNANSWNNATMMRYPCLNTVINFKLRIMNFQSQSLIISFIFSWGINGLLYYESPKAEWLHKHYIAILLNWSQ